MDFFAIRNWKDKNSKSPFAKRLIELRKIKGFTQKEVSKRTGVALPTYGTYENGIYLPTIDTIVKIADIYNVSTDYLLGRETKNDNLEIERRKAVVEELKFISLEYESTVKEAQKKYFKQIKEILKKEVI